MRASRSSGFTLLEVLVAIAILGLGMTAILSAQTGLFASSSYAERVSLASGLVRCKLSELELKLNKEGYPLTDMKDEGNCCNDESPPAGYKCKWKIEKIEMPLPPTSTELSNQMSSAMGPGGLGALGAIASVGQSNGSILGQGSGLGDVSKLLAGQAPGGIPGGSMPPGGTFGGGIPGGSPSPADSNSFGSTAFGSSSFGSSSFGQKVAGTVPIGSGQVDQGLGGPPMGGGISSLVPMVMSMVYPTLKPMLEASIRKLTVSVEWQGGGKGKSLDIVEFVTNPMQGGLDPNAAGGLDSAFSAISGLLGGAAPGGVGAGTTGAAAPSLLGGSR
ncbi:MAG TPA: type II secretion system protein [Polyangiaceae bacterium]|nr:type II secretion system protein [Polyangiaceae bacterium]